MNPQTRLQHLEAEHAARQGAELQAAGSTLWDWIAVNASAAELSEWDRYWLTRLELLPFTDADLARSGLTREQADAILTEVGPYTAEDAAIVDALTVRVPPALFERINNAHGVCYIQPCLLAR